MLCPDCQFENPEGIKFCGECGTKLETLCPSCNSSNPPNFKFCGECGGSLIELPKETTPIQYSAPKSYTPKFLADKILTTRSSIEGERKLVSVLFADVANYTGMSEKLDPEEVHQIMDGCFKILMDEIHRYEGTINQFTGDGVMALFGAPVAHEDHAQRGCRSALAIQKAMDEYGQKIERDCNIEFKLRIGLNSGPVIVGAIGDDLRMDYTAVGDTTNLAMRMESMAEPGAVQISETTYRLVEAYFDCEDLGSGLIKGKEEPQRAFRLIKPSEVQTRIEASISKGLVRFVGRKNSMIAIQNAWDKAANGSGQVLGVVGEAGVGKSRLLFEFRNSLANIDFNYFEGHCLHYGGSMAYLPILDILKAFIEIDEGQREYLINKSISEKLTTLDAERLSDSRPAFQDLLSLKVEDESWLKLEPKVRREQTFEALKNLFIRLSEEKPLIIAVEDLHWMDKTSEEFINYFIDSMANNSILLIILYRPEYTHQWGSKSYYSKIGLNQLTMESSGELVSAILEGGEVATELKELILNRSAGNPLFMEEFTHTLLENGSIERRDEKFVLSKNSDDIKVPDTIQGIIASRLDRLEDNLKRTMQVASVIGRDFAFRILQTITGMREELKSYLLNLQGLEFIYEKSLFPELEYIFKHALTQEVAYNSLLNKRRKEIHEKIGQAIEQIYADKLQEFYEMLAYHYSKSENHEKAYHYFKLSGIRANEKYSHWEALALFKDAIKSLNQLPQTEDNKHAQIDIRLLMSSICFSIGIQDDTFELLKEGEKFAKELGEDKKLSQLYHLIRYYYVMKGNLQEAESYGEDLYRKAVEINDLDLTVSTAYDLCFNYFYTGQYVKLAQSAQKVLFLIEREDRQTDDFGLVAHPYIVISGVAGFSLGNLGDFETGIGYCEKGLEVAGKINEPFVLGCILSWYGMMHTVRGDGTLAVNYLEQSVKYLEKANEFLFRSTALVCLCRAHLFLGDRASSHVAADESLAIANEYGLEVVKAFAYYAESLLFCDEGDFKQAFVAAEKGLTIAKNSDYKYLEMQNRLALGKIVNKLNTSEYDDAKNHILRGIMISEEMPSKPYTALGYLYLGEIDYDSGRNKEAHHNLKKAEKMFKEMGMLYWLNMAQTLLERL